jgi:nitrogen fixation protein NifU and related proteins
MTVDLRELYQEMILDHNKNPRNFGKLENADQSAEGYNPLCGDHYWFHVRFDGDRVAEVKFEGSGCAISKSSASVMTTTVKGRTRAEVEELFQRFRSMITGETKADESLGKLAAFSGVCEHPSRIKCAILPWHTMHSALAGEVKATTE